MRALIKRACAITVQAGSVVEITADQFARLSAQGLAEPVHEEKPAEKPAKKTAKK